MFINLIYVFLIMILLLFMFIWNKNYFRPYFIGSILVLHFINIVEVRAMTESCSCEGLWGTFSENYCRIRNYINTLPDYDPMSKIYGSARYIFLGRAGLGKKAAAVNMFAGTNVSSIKVFDLVALAQINDPNKVKKIFEEAEKELNESKRPVVLVFLNFDVIAKKQRVHGDETEYPYLLGMANVIPAYLDIYKNNPYMVMIFTSNLKYGQLNNPLLSRMECIYCDFPKRKNRVAIANMYNNNNALPETAINIISFLNYGVTGKDIKDALTTSSGQNGKFVGKIKQSYDLIKNSYTWSVAKAVTVVTSGYLLMRLGIKLRPKQTSTNTQHDISRL